MKKKNIIFFHGLFLVYEFISNLEGCAGNEGGGEGGGVWLAFFFNLKMQNMVP